MSKLPLRLVDKEQEHPCEIAKRRVEEYEQSKQPKQPEQPEQPITNIHVPEEIRPPSLNVDEVLKKSLPSHLGKKM